MAALAAEQLEAGTMVKALTAEETNELEGGIAVTQEVQPVLVEVAAAAATTAPRLMKVRVPGGVAEGQPFFVDIGDGQQMMVACPAGSAPGSEIQIEVAAAKAAPPAGQACGDGDSKGDDDDTVPAAVKEGAEDLRYTQISCGQAGGRAAFLCRSDVSGNHSRLSRGPADGCGCRQRCVGRTDVMRQ